MSWKVISGGQIGVDIAALRAAKAVGLKTGGAMPKGFRTDTASKPQYAELFGCHALASPDYPPRTRANVLAADLTLLLAVDLNSQGSRTTRRAAQEGDKPVYEVQLPTNPKAALRPEVRAGLVQKLREASTAAGDKFVLNVAGNRGGNALESAVEKLLQSVFAEVLEATK